MSSPYFGEIRMFAGNFAPEGWMLCQGQILPISEFETLFNLIGTTYGGDGQSTFALPDLQGRIPIHMGGSHVLAERAGSETVTLTASQMPAHSHPLSASMNAASSASTPADATANTGATSLYAPPAAGVLDATMSSSGVDGGSQPHDNMAPYLCVNFIIAVVAGIFPSQT
jgi:microcystin-dependent protein